MKPPILCALVLLLSGVSMAVAADRPNVLLIYTDDHAQGATGAYEQTELWLQNHLSGIGWFPHHSVVMILFADRS